MVLSSVPMRNPEHLVRSSRKRYEPRAGTVSEKLMNPNSNIRPNQTRARLQTCTHN